MKRVIPCVVALVVLTLVPSAARADERGFIRGFTGVSFGTKAGGVFGVGFGGSVKKNVQIFGEIGRIGNVMPKSVVQGIEVAAGTFATANGGKSSSSAGTRAMYGLFGVKTNLRDINGYTPFLEFGVGAAHLTSTVSSVIRGSTTLTGDITNQLSIPFIAATPATKAMATFGTGVSVSVGKRAAIEVGYRYARIFTSNPGINAHRVSGAIHVGF